MNFKAIGKDVTIYPWARIVSPEVISIGDHVIVDDYVFLQGGLGITLGSYIHLSAYSAVMGGGELIMGDFSGLSGRTMLYTGGEDYGGKYLTNPTVPFPYRQPWRTKVVLGRHVLIGSGCTVLSGPNGLTIGEGATVGAMSLVNHDLEPWMVYVGVPARPIKKRDRNRVLELEQQLREAMG